MIRGIIYLTGLMTLALLGLAAAVAFRVDNWPWRDYAEDGRRYLAERLEDAKIEDEAEVHQDDPQSQPAVDPSPEPPTDRQQVPLTIRHTVRRGDTLYAIAGRYYGRSEKWQLIARANEIRRPADLRVGRVILIPMGALSAQRDAGWFEPKLELAPAIEPGEGTVP